MEIRIGIAHSPRELSFEMSQSPTEVEQTVVKALTAGTTHVSLKDDKGTLYLIPVAGLSYIEIGGEESRRVGFVA